MSSNPEPNRQELVFILGLSHTGSTLLDLTLGNHPRYIGLGEIYQVIRPDFNRFQNNELCSCGKLQNDCPFWGRVAEVLAKNSDQNIQKRYELVLHVFRDIFGKDQIPVDSSKLPEALNLARRIVGIDLKTVYLIRDVRAWTVSRLNARKNNPANFSKNGMYVKRLTYQNPIKMLFLKFFVPFLTTRPFYYFLLWYYQNRKLRSMLEEQKISSFGISYEELGLYPEKTVPKLFQYLGVEEGGVNLSPYNSQSHILVGNKKKADPACRRRIVYDNQWMYRREWLVSAAIFQNIIKYNNKEVYRNIQKGAIWG